MWFESYFCIPTTAGITGKLSRAKLAKYKNHIAFQNSFMRFSLDALKRYDVDGLPPTMSRKVILQSLLWYGGVVMFEKNGGLYALPGAPTGDGFNLYGDPGKAWVWAKNGQMNEQITLNIPGGDESAYLEIMTTMRQAGKGHGVFIWENAQRFPFINQVMAFAEIISDSYRMLDTMRNNLKHPYIIACEEATLSTVNKFLNERDENVDAITLLNTGIYGVDKIKILPLDLSSQNLRDATEIIEWYENKFRELCGFNSNVQIDKKGENLISDEINANDEYEGIQTDKSLNYLNESVSLFNKLYGTNIRFFKKEVEENRNVEHTDEKDKNLLPNKE